jgi:thiol-disulfide isomerase/thioredoxin
VQILGRPSRSLLLALAVGSSLSACTRAPSGGAGDWAVARDSQSARLHVVMINGGGNPAQNYQSHLIHVQQLADLLRQSGVAPNRIAIFAADGADPSPDLAVREPQPEREFWRLHGTRLAAILRTPVSFTDSEVPGFTLHPATNAELTRWFSDTGDRLQPGDTLLIYVTDHGTKNAQDPTDNFITLWGKDEALSVRQLRTLLATLDPRVRVVVVMSQCFSGSFAHLMDSDGGVPSGNVCGFFSSTAERPAYGCYPENRGRENVGHSFHFIEALAVTGSLTAAHDRVLVSDATPDVPLRTSDIYLEQLLRRAANEQGKSFERLVDELLQEAWNDKARWEPDIRQLDRIGAAYGSFSARSLAELEEQTRSLPGISAQFRSVDNAWRQTSADANANTFQRFMAKNPEWAQRLPEPPVQLVDEATTRALTVELLDALSADGRRDPAGEARVTTLRDKHEAAAAAAYRMEVRLAVALRMRSLLTSIAGRVYLEHATAAERHAFERLRACEDLRLPPSTPAGPLLAAADPFPSFDEDVRAATEALPAWMGIQFRDPTPEQRAKHRVNEGAAVVLNVYPSSPAEKAGLEPGDIIIGPPGDPFTEARQIRAWTMLSPVGDPQRLEVLREGKRVRLALVPEPYPIEWPKLPGPPKVGSMAPKLKLSSYRGRIPELASGTPHLLFFWATWCLPCKAALPEVLAFERQRHVPVLAITDEPPEQLANFFKTAGDFPENVAVDEYRRAFVAYGVSGTPTFVLVEGNGKVRSYSTGYSPSTGLGIDGWKWAKEERQGGDG